MQIKRIRVFTPEQKERKKEYEKQYRKKRRRNRLKELERRWNKRNPGREGEYRYNPKVYPKKIKDLVGEEAAKHRKNLRHKREYGITCLEYEDGRKTQNFRCAICNTSESEFFYAGASKIKCLFVDHDHTTGKVRGLICPSCNIVLGHVKDRVEILQSAINYLLTPPGIPKKEKSFGILV